MGYLELGTKHCFLTYLFSAFIFMGVILFLPSQQKMGIMTLWGFILRRFMHHIRGIPDFVETTTSTTTTISTSMGLSIGPGIQADRPQTAVHYNPMPRLIVPNDPKENEYFRNTKIPIERLNQSSDVQKPGFMFPLKPVPRLMTLSEKDIRTADINGNSYIEKDRKLETSPPRFLDILWQFRIQDTTKPDIQAQYPLIYRHFSPRRKPDFTIPTRRPAGPTTPATPWLIPTRRAVRITTPASVFPDVTIDQFSRSELANSGLKTGRLPRYGTWGRRGIDFEFQ